MRGKGKCALILFTKMNTNPMQQKSILNGGEKKVYLIHFINLCIYLCAYLYTYIHILQYFTKLCE